jgi:hypothetical protein
MMHNFFEAANCAALFWTHRFETGCVPKTIIRYKDGAGFDYVQEFFFLISGGSRWQKHFGLL